MGNKKRDLVEKDSPRRVSNNVLAAILVVVILVGLFTIGVALTSEQTAMVYSNPSTLSASATGEVVIEIIEPPESATNDGG